MVPLSGKRWVFVSLNVFGFGYWSVFPKIIFRKKISNLFRLSPFIVEPRLQIKQKIVVQPNHMVAIPTPLSSLIKQLNNLVKDYKGQYKMLFVFMLII